MPAKKRRPRKVQTASAQHKQRDQDVVRLINEAVANGDVQQVRKLAAVRGLVNGELRARLWPCLLGGRQPALGGPVAAAAAAAVAGRLSRQSSSSGGGIGPHGAAANGTAANGSVGGAAGGLSQAQQYLEWADGTHKDNSTVRVDVERSLHSFASFLSDEERAARRQELTRMLNAVVVKHEGDVHYYQGLHDVASVLLLVAGESAAFDLLCRLATGHLRDATRPSLDPVIELLGLMGPIVEAADPQLAAFLQQQGLPPFYALSWFITWFSHDLSDFSEVCRLFDLFLATHPLMPLYVGAVAMHSQRDRLLAADEMPVLHSQLVNLRITRRATADELAMQAIELYKRAQPEVLIASRQLMLQQAITPRVKLRLGVWEYPPPISQSPGLWSQQRLQGLVQQMIRLPLPGTLAQRKKLVMASITGVLGSLYVVALLLASSTRHSDQPGAPLASLLYKL